MRAVIKKFYDLTHDELFDIYQARSEVFVVEQNCVYQDVDAYDKQSFHVLLYDGEKIGAYCRILPPKLKYDECAIGRVLTMAPSRGKGAGKILMNAALDEIKAQGWGAIRISAQAYLKKFYQDLGFSIVGDEYLEDNIPHFEMLCER